MKRILVLLLIFVFFSCNEETVNDEDISDFSKIVVEGWIEEGDYPQVLLSRSVPIPSEIDSLAILKYAIRSAKVTVSDGQNQEVLRLKRNNDLIPPFIYVGSELMGQVGKTYSLKVEYLGTTLQASTYIPKTVVLKSAVYLKDNPADTTGYVFVNFEDPIYENNYYQITTKVDNSEPLFVPALYGNLNDENFKSSIVSMQINRGILVSQVVKYNPFFSDNDLIFVKLRTLNKETYDFWNSWQNEVVNARNPIYPSNTSLKSNIKGGLGIWAGYGQSLVIIAPTKKR